MPNTTNLPKHIALMLGVKQPKALKLGLARTFELLDEDEKQEIRTQQFESAYAYLIKWFLQHKKLPLKLVKPFYRKPLRRRIAETPRHTLALFALPYTTDKIHTLQAAICAERIAGQIALLSNFIAAIINLFARRNITLTAEQQTILWSGLTNTGDYRDFPLEELGVNYANPSFPAELLPEMPGNAATYHRNVAGAVAAVIFVNRLRPHPNSVRIISEEDLFAQSYTLTTELIVGLMQVELAAQQQMRHLRSAAQALNNSDRGFIADFDHTWTQRSDFFSSPLIGVAPSCAHDFAAFNGPFPTQTSGLSSEQWRNFMQPESEQFPAYLHEQVLVVEQRQTAFLSLRPF